MAISYPRAMPGKLARVVFEPAHQVVHNAERGGRAISVVIGPARWEAEFATADLREPDLSEWRAWIASLQGGAKTFYAGDPSKPYPRAYPTGFSGMTRAGGGSFDGTATSWSIDSSRAVLTLNGLPASFAISIGDMTAFEWSTSKRYLVRALEAATANGSGVATFTVEPKIETLVSSGAVATLANPQCVMRLTPDGADIDLRPGPIGRASFKAVQHLEA